MVWLNELNMLKMALEDGKTLEDVIAMAEAIHIIESKKNNIINEISLLSSFIQKSIDDWLYDNILDNFQLILSSGLEKYVEAKEKNII